jgi:hypothetical protein
MAATLQAQWDATYGPTQFTGSLDPSKTDPTHFQQRISMAMMQVAVAVATEVSTTQNHVNRLALAQKILWNPLQWMGPIAQACASQGLDQSSTDAALVSILTNGWNALAGVA